MEVSKKCSEKEIRMVMYDLGAGKYRLEVKTCSAKEVLSEQGQMRVNTCLATVLYKEVIGVKERCNLGLRDVRRSFDCQLQSACG